MFSLNLLAKLAEKFPKPFSRSLHESMPIIAAGVWDTKADVKKAAVAAMQVGRTGVMGGV